MTRIRVATYNLHSGIGVDRRFKPQRIIDVIGELDADVVALQELLSPVRGFDVHEHLRAETGLHLVAMTTMQLAGGTFGNAVLSRWPIIDVVEHGLTVGTREPRGALDVTIGRDLRELRVIATHLGLRTSERQRAAERACSRSRATATICRPCSPAISTSRAHAHASCARAPSISARSMCWRRFLRSRRCCRSIASSSHGGAKLTGIAVHRSRRARMASDHLPLVATIEIAD